MTYIIYRVAQNAEETKYKSEDDVQKEVKKLLNGFREVGQNISHLRFQVDGMFKRCHIQPKMSHPTI